MEVKDKNIKLKRKSGVLLHPTSLPGSYGIGDLGEEAYDFVNFLEQSGQTLWQVLPLGPTGYGDSPYASFSTHAGNPMLISPKVLLDRGYLNNGDFTQLPDNNNNLKIDYGTLIPWKNRLLSICAKRFLEGDFNKKEFLDFCLEESSWLDDFALFMAVKEFFDKKALNEGVHGAMWSNFWDKDIALRDPNAMSLWSLKLKDEIEQKKVLQYFFFDQWLKLRVYANNKNVEIIGDIPIFVASDSSDVWANRDLFLLDENGCPLSVAGVPPDYFSETGQLWGNPLYNWEVMEKKHFKWWIDRIKSMLKMVDIIRVDHFRGFEAFWQVPANEETAENGEWVKAPGYELFKEVRRSLGRLPILAEDLGVITKDVDDLRDAFNFPGMRILQFAFDAEEGDNGITSDSIFQPHNYINNSVVYTGTHDNSTMKGWLDMCKPVELNYLREYYNYYGDDLVWLFILSALSSTSGYAIIPLQDFLELDDNSRMNIPSTVGGNWCWRYNQSQLSENLITKIKKYTTLYGRI